MKKILGVLFGVCVAGCGAVAEFSKGETIELSQDAPLLFRQTTVRVAKKGERFIVLLDRPAEHRVYVSGRDASGQEIALSIAEDAVVAAQQPPPPVVEPPSVLPMILAARMGAERRAKALTAHGGKPESEAAVGRALHWLVTTQNEDGSWCKGSKPITAAMTGFSLLSFLGHGETPASPDFGPAVQKAINWMLANGDANEGRLSMENQFSQPGVYAHAIATYALGEYYTMTRDERVVDLLKKAVGHILEGQGPDGGWMYSYDRTESDTSVSGWQIQALKAAHLTGLDIPGVPLALDKAMDNLKRVRGKNGGFGYRNAAAEKYSLTGVGVYCTYVWKQEKDMVVRDGMEYIMEKSAREYPIDYRHERADLYAWYYDTLACALVGGRSWEKWNGSLQDQLLRNQAPDGSWPPLAGKSAGGEYQRSPEMVGKLYRTTLCALMLEVYYRYSGPGQ
ncbi:MAG TPA: prenyltransferase/squalene oxidase repeat-containing protein [Chthoniobacter sp.]|nr:prenyltransferase/squalene oxidase repeat-containing protein [Chthoniobacter sp.]